VLQHLCKAIPITDPRNGLRNIVLWRHGCEWYSIGQWEGTINILQFMKYFAVSSKTTVGIRRRFTADWLPWVSGFKSQPINCYFGLWIFEILLFLCRTMQIKPLTFSCLFFKLIFQAESGWNAVPSWLCLETVIKNQHETSQRRIYSRELLMMGREDSRNM